MERRRRRSPSGSRSRSPLRERDNSSQRASRRHRHGRRHDDKHSERRKREREYTRKREEPAMLPYRANKLSKTDFDPLRPLFASYLDIQKQIFLDDLDQDEARGRWKSFVGKWNRGELAEGWYDPQTKRKALEAAVIAEAEVEAEGRNHTDRTGNAQAARSMRKQQEDHGSSSDDEYGPKAPPPSAVGPRAPGFQDLELRDEMNAEAEQARLEEIRHRRKLDRRNQKEQLDEIVPRAEAGTRERQLEKRRETATANKSFADARAAGDGMTEVGDGVLMGGSDDVRSMRQRDERRKNERELRKEEILRARAEERDIRLRAMREKEDATMDLLKAIARERFGGAGA